MLPSKINSTKISPVLTTRLQHDFTTIEYFKNVYQKNFGIPFPKELKSNEFSKSNALIRNDYTAHLYYETIETSSSLALRHERPKLNTYKLCPYCDPFENINNSNPSTCTRDGKLEIIDNKLPKFYDSIHYEYDDHLAIHHGIYINGSNFYDPLVGFCLFEGGYTPVMICPYADCSEGCECDDDTHYHENKMEPCLGLFKFDCSSKNPYIEYFKHVYDHHMCVKTTNLLKYEEYIESEGFIKEVFFFPLETENYINFISGLRMFCNDDRLFPVKVPFDIQQILKVQSLVFDSEDEEYINSINGSEFDVELSTINLSPVITPSSDEKNEDENYEDNDNADEDENDQNDDDDEEYSEPSSASTFYDSSDESSDNDSDDNSTSNDLTDEDSFITAYTQSEDSSSGSYHSFSSTQSHTKFTDQSSDDWEDHSSGTLYSSGSCRCEHTTTSILETNINPSETTVSNISLGPDSEDCVFNSRFDDHEPEIDHSDNSLEPIVPLIAGIDFGFNLPFDEDELILDVEQDRHEHLNINGVNNVQVRLDSLYHDGPENDFDEYDGELEIGSEDEFDEDGVPRISEEDIIEPVPAEFQNYSRTSYNVEENEAGYNDVHIPFMGHWMPEQVPLMTSSNNFGDYYLDDITAQNSINNSNRVVSAPLINIPGSTNSPTVLFVNCSYTITSLDIIRHSYFVSIGSFQGVDPQIHLSHNLYYLETGIWIEPPSLEQNQSGLLTRLFRDTYYYHSENGAELVNTMINHFNNETGLNPNPNPDNQVRSNPTNSIIPFQQHDNTINAVDIPQINPNLTSSTIPTQQHDNSMNAVDMPQINPNPIIQQQPNTANTDEVSLISQRELEQIQDFQEYFAYVNRLFSVHGTFLDIDDLNSDDEENQDSTDWKENIDPTNVTEPNGQVGVQPQVRPPVPTTGHNRVIFGVLSHRSRENIQRGLNQER